MYTESLAVQGSRPVVSPAAAGEAIVADGTLEVIAAQLALNALVGLVILPAYCVPLDFTLIADDLDTGTNLTLSVGVLNSTEDDLVASTNMLTDSTVGQAGGSARATALPLADDTADRVIAAKVTTGGVAVVAATGTITSDGTNVSDTDTVTVGTKTYTFKTTLTPTEGEVLIGDTAAETLDNLKLAINRTDPETNDGVKYKVAAAHTTIEATTNTDTVQTVQALTAGADGNSIALEEASTHLTVSGATLSGGVTAVPLQGGTIRGILTYRAAEYGV